MIMTRRSGSLLTLALCSVGSAGAAVSVTGPSFTYTQNFNTLASTTSPTPTIAAWVNDTTIPGWNLFTSTLAAPTTYRAEYGDQDTGSFTSYGGIGSTDRALGAVGYSGAYFGSPATGAAAGYIAAAFTNNAGTTLNSFTLGFSGEQWRWSGTTPHSMTMQYGFGATFAAVASWASLGASFTFTSPLTSGTPQGGVDGNGIGRVTGLGGTQATSWSAGQTLWLRWLVPNTANSFQGTGIDDASLSVTAVPEPASLLLFAAGFAVIVGAARKRTRGG